MEEQEQIQDENNTHITEETLSVEETQPLAEDNVETKEGNVLELEIVALKEQLAEQKDKYLRLFADFDNYKKRNAKERLDLIQTAGKDVLVSLLPVVDDFERAQKAAETSTEIEPVKEGLALIYHKFTKNLEARGLKPMEAIGEVFDVEKHEAITEIPAPNEAMVGKVIDQVEKGYFLNDKIIRFAKVVVGK